MAIRSRCRILFVFLFVLGLAAQVGAAAGLRFDKSEYAARRAKLMDKIGDSTAFIWSAQTPGNYYPTAQANDFLYLTGVELPNTALLLDGAAKTSTLFMTATEDQVRQEGINADLAKNPREFTGIEQIVPFERVAALLTMMAGRSKILYTPYKPEELFREVSTEKLNNFLRNVTINPWDGRLTRELQFVKIVKERYPQLEIRDLSPLIWDLRMIKTPAEIALLRRAGKIGVKAHIEIMKACRPGMREYELSAVWNYICESQGAQENAYGVIITSGENHPYLHYNKHDRLLKDGDFLVVDAGPDLDSYDIDITTSFPANGIFTPRQKEIYEAALAVHENSVKVYRPGLTAEQCRKEVDELLANQGFDLKKDYFQRMRGEFGHYVGMATHDVGGGPSVLKPGMVFANEPLAVLAAENLGVRVEDTVLITETGCEVLTAGIPRTVKDIEALMKKEGLPQRIRK
jgi:Xaa-Pro aminopeptidase